MNSLFRLFLATILSFSIYTEAHAVNRAYVHEINRVREIESQFVGEANAQLNALNEYYLVWFQLNQELSRLRVDLSVNKNESDLDKANAVKVFGRDLLFEISQARRQLQFYEGRFAPLLNTLTSLRGEHAKKWQEVNTSIDQLESTVQQRLKEASAYTEKWLEWQYSVFLRDRNLFSKNNIEDVQWYQAYLDVNSLILKTVEMAKYTWNFGNRTKMDAYVAALSILSTTIPNFFEGSLTSAARLNYVKNLVATAENGYSQIKELMSSETSASKFLASHLNSLAEVSLDTSSFQNKNNNGLDPAPPTEGTDEVEDKITKSSHEQYCRTSPDFQKQVSEVVPNPEFPGTWTDDAKTNQSVNRTKVEWRKSPDGSQGWTKTEVTGSISYGDGVKDEIKVCLERKVTEGLRNSNGGNAGSNNNLQDDIDEFRSDVERGIRNTRYPEEAQELSQLKNELDRLAYKNELFKRELEKSAAKTKQELDRAAREPRASAVQFNSANNLPREIPSFPKKEDLQKEENELTRQLLDAILGMPPVVGNAYNAASFVTSLINGTTPIGVPTTQLDTVIFGAGVIVPMGTKIPGIKTTISVGIKGAKFITKIARAAPGSVKISNVFKLVRGYLKAQLSGVIEIVEDVSMVGGDTATAFLNIVDDAENVQKVSIELIEERTLRIRSSKEKPYDNSFKPGSNGAILTVGEGKNTVYRIGSSAETQLSEFASLEKPKMDIANRQNYLSKHGVNPNKAEKYDTLYKHDLSKGDTLLVGPVKEVDAAKGDGIQVIIENPNWKISE